MATATIEDNRGKAETIRVTTNRGALPGFQVIGGGHGLHRELRDRIRAAMLTAGFNWPHYGLTIEVPVGRVDASLDLPIAVGILSATGQISLSVEGFGAIGELGLDGSVKPGRNSISRADAAECETLAVEAGTVDLIETVVTGDNTIGPAKTAIVGIATLADLK